MLSIGKHTLTTQLDADDLHKQCILVKLTESSAKAIEEYIKNSKKHSAQTPRPTIVFTQGDSTGVSGEIVIPLPQTNKKYSFSLAPHGSNKGQRQDSWECVSYINSRLRTIGPIEHKLTVKGQDDSYQRIGELIKTGQEVEEKNKAKELPAKNSAKASGLSKSTNQHHHHPKSAISQIIARASPANGPNSSAAIAASGDSIHKPRHLERPMRERVVHWLALKSLPFKEIANRLTGGQTISPREKTDLEGVLNAVATQQQPSKEYKLNQDVLLSGEVKEDWAHYSGDEKQQVKRNIAAARLARHQQKEQQQREAAAAVTKSAVAAAAAPADGSSSPLSSLFTAPGKQQSQSQPQQQRSSASAFAGYSKPLKQEPAVPIKAEKVEKIESLAQRDAYKTEFDSLYDEYSALQEYMENIAALFTKYRDELSQLTPQSDEYEKKRRQIEHEYATRRKDPQHVKKRDRYVFLRDKLTAILEQIKRYEETII